MGENKEWKSKLGFPINFSPGHSSEDEIDTSDVVMRRGQSTRVLLDDCGDGAEADLLGSTPPREHRRDKEKKRSYINSTVSLRDSRRSVDESVTSQNIASSSDYIKRHFERKLQRKQARDMKDSTNWEKAESLPLPSTPAAPTMVESCNRFMCLSSRLKSREPRDAPAQRRAADARASFHNTFSMLINMGKADKSCKRAISREEQVWQSELKDLIWLELQAVRAGRSLGAQDRRLCALRRAVPAVLKAVMEFRFEYPHPCTGFEDDGEMNKNKTDDTNDDNQVLGCVSLECRQCAGAVSKCVRAAGQRLAALDAAAALYPSTSAMTHDHPVVATTEFQDTVKTMCVWYNTARSLLGSLAAVRRLARAPAQRPALAQLASTDSDISRNSSETRQCQVRFNASATPTDSGNSEYSGDNRDCSDDNKDDADDKDRDTVDSSCERKTENTTPPTPEITIECAESGLESASDDDAPAHGRGDLAHLRLLGKRPVSIYRSYHRELLKTQSVRRCLATATGRRRALDRAARALTPLQINEKPAAQTQDKDGDYAGLREEDAFELQRYGCWSAEARRMRLPSYRTHFLLLSAVRLEAVHDYLSLRLDDQPQDPSCLTIKQLIHELKEGLNIAVEARAAFERHVRAAVGAVGGVGGAGGAGGAPRQRVGSHDLLKLLRQYDETVVNGLCQYLSYLRSLSVTEPWSRASLLSEWGFAATCARTLPAATERVQTAFGEIICNQLNRIRQRLDEKFRALADLEPKEEEPSRQAVYQLCRSAQALYSCEREAALQAALSARALAPRLTDTQRQEVFEALISVRDVVVKQTQLIVSRSAAADLEAAALPRVRELLLHVYKLGFELHRELYRLSSVPSTWTSRRPASMPPGTLAHARPPRPLTMIVPFTTIHKELHRVTTKAGACAGGRARLRYMRSDSVFEDAETTALDDRLFDSVQHGEGELVLEELLGGEPPQRVPTEAAEAKEAEGWGEAVARGVVQFARCWMQFVLQRCDPGRGTRPRWASQGLEFLILACDPSNTKHLSDEEFEELKKEMDSCISHVIGSRALDAPADKPRRVWAHSPKPSVTPPAEPSAEPSAEPLTDEAQQTLDEVALLHNQDGKEWCDRVSAAAATTDASRDLALSLARRVGRASTAAAPPEPRLRQLRFNWQRGLKIGAGSFGKVYTVVNTESGQLLAMKEVSIAAGDRRALQRAANELRVLEGVLHPHLVRYYGVEIHREEMLIFMELCVEGSLEALVATAGALGEPTVRRYARQLLSAVAELHDRGIAHRDIKSGNIFLTNEGHCLKLGDFGCAVKIRGHNTAVGELMGCVGTQAYMAPEVFMQSSGHGRAADIWSVGCVVTEMASGKRPFAEFDANYQIMFAVGLGGGPEVPETMSAEGASFCSSCLTRDPELRPRAEDLLLHHFLMVRSDDEDCKCETAPLLSK